MPELKDLMKIVALIENTTRTCRPVEHGLSLYIETDRHCLLFDTGQSPLLAENAAFFGVDLKKVDLCFLSHGHYDHGGGLAAFAAIVNHPALRELPFCLETPHELDGYAKEIAMLRGLRQ